MAEEKNASRWHYWMVPLLLALVSLALALLGEQATLLLRLEREGLLGGEVWRIFSGHLVHLGWSHLWLNFAGLLLVWVLVGRAFSPAQWLGLMLWCALGISLGLLWWLPQLQWYVGLSGLLYGMLMGGCLQGVWRGEREAMVILLILCLKMAYELWQGPMPGSREVAGGEVIYQAHTLGCICAILYVMAQKAVRLRA